MELILLVIVIALVALILVQGDISITGLIVNGILGVVLIFLTNLVLVNDIPINLVTILICAVGG